VYSTYLGGSGEDAGTGIAVDSSGNAYVTGYTRSTNFPTANALYATYGGGNADAFVAKLNAAGSALVYSTYLGGSGEESSGGIAVDSSGNAYVTGSTPSTNFPTANALYATNGGADAFVAKLNATGSALVYCTYLGGSGLDVGPDISVDSSGNAYVTGFTNSTDFPTANALYASYGGGNLDAFVAKLNAAGSALVYSTYLGGSGEDLGHGIAVDSSGNAYVTGYTLSTNFPTANALYATQGGGNDGFIAKLNAAGSALVYSTYLGGSGDDAGYGIAVDSSGNAYVTGLTNSANFPIANALYATYGGGSFDAFVAKIVPPHLFAAQIQPPINSDGSSVFGAKRGVVPMKFTLTSDGLATCDLPPAAISVTRTMGTVTGVIDESVYETTADTGTSFRIDSCQYVYNLGSVSLGPGTYRVDIRIGGNVAGNAVFALK
jgi:hypothetical protein